MANRSLRNKIQVIWVLSRPASFGLNIELTRTFGGGNYGKQY
jgi:hypothetical protein